MKIKNFNYFAKNGQDVTKVLNQSFSKINQAVKFFRLRLKFKILRFIYFVF